MKATVPINQILAPRLCGKKKRTDPSEVRIIVPVKDGVSRVTTLLNILW